MKCKFAWKAYWRIWKLDKKIKKLKKKIDKGMDTLVKEDLPRDKKIEKCDTMMKKSKKKPKR